MKKAVLLFLLLVVGANGYAADEAVVAIRAARMIDGVSDRAVEDAVVVVSGNKIVAAGKRSAVTIPEGARTIDLGDSTLLPGLIDTHTHILIQGDITQEDYDKQVLRETMAYRALRASRSARIALEHGFTTLRDVDTEGAMYTDVDIKKAINNGVIPGPRLFVSTRAMSVTGGYGPSGYTPEVIHPKGVQIVDGVENARKAVREQVSNGADWIKVYCDRSYFVDSKGKLMSTPTFTLEELKAIVDETHRLRRKVAAHAIARPGLENALAAGVDSIEHGISIDDDLLEEMAERGIFLAPTLTVTEYVAPGRAAAGGEIWAKIPAFHHDTFRRAVKEGVKVAFGTDVGGFDWDLNQAREFSYMTRFGMTPMQAIKAATTVAADLIDMEEKLGALKPGYLADVVAVPGDPLEAIEVMERVHFVMKDGVVFRNDTAK